MFMQPNHLFRTGRRWASALAIGVWLSIGSWTGTAWAYEEPGAASAEAAAARSEQLHLEVKASPNATYMTQTELTDKKLIRELDAAAESGAWKEPLPPDTVLRYPSRSGAVRELGLTPAGDVVDLARCRSLRVSDATRHKLAAQVTAQRAKHYGELLTWEEASLLLPKYSSFTIVDLETGLQFRGQRRAGSSHADVQPLTKADSAALKAIYGGAWSWDRRAVLVEIDGRRLAASMHGMPHGGDGIPDNGFNGHFCIHFLGSVTHGSHAIDPAHQVMVHKAAGQLPAYLAKLSAWELIDVWIAAANQGDQQLLQAVSAATPPNAVPVRTMRRLSRFPERDTTALLELHTEVDVAATPEGRSQPQKKRVLFHLERDSPADGWRIRRAELR